MKSSPQLSAGILIAYLSIFNLAPSQAGDWSGAYNLFVGNWKKSECVGDQELSKIVSDISISATHSRGTEVNVYFLNSKQKKTRLFFSTSPLLIEKAKFRVVEKRPSDASKMSFKLAHLSQTIDLKIVSVDIKSLKIEVKSDDGATTCLMTRM